MKRDILFSLLLPLCSSALLWLSYPGGGELWPLLFFALVPLLAVAGQRGPKGAFYGGLITGWVHFILSLYWIVIVLGRYGGLPLAVSLPALLLLSFYMGLFVACFSLSAAVIYRRYSAFAAIWIIPAVWVGLDWLRSFLFSGFPWMDPGYALWQVPLLIQTADLFGHYGITFLVLLSNCLLVALASRGVSARQKASCLSSVAAVSIAIGLYGHYRLLEISQSIDNGERVSIGIVQGNIDQSRKWTPAEQRGTIDGYISATVSLFTSASPPELVVWPETALPFFPATHSLTRELRGMVRENDVVLLTGSPWFERNNDDSREVRYYNSAFMLHPDGRFGDIYFKSHLVPFGEYVPMKRLLPFLAPLVEAVGDFTPGTVEKPLVAGSIRAGVLICFESIFPDIGRQWIDAGANVLVNLTNDAWYGRSSAPSQSMAMSVFRAVETRRSLVRAANTGISGFVDPLGRVTEMSAIFTNWAKSVEVTLLEEVTFYVRYGKYFMPACLLVSLGALLMASAGGGRRPRKERI